jgi:hypothetical protein
MNTSIRRFLSALLLVAFFGGGSRTAVAAPAQHALGGTITGLATGNSVVLRNANGAEVTVTRNGSFTFGSFAEGASYAVTVKTHPSYPAANCTVTGGTGTIGALDITMGVNCIPLPQITSLAFVDATRARTVTAIWSELPSNVSGTAKTNIYISTRGDCDFRSSAFTGCPGEKKQPTSRRFEVTTFGGQRLKNGQAYFVQVETVFANGAKGLSNLVSARPNELAFNGAVRAITTDPNGTVYLGGDFTGVGVTTGSAVPLNISNGMFATPNFPLVAGTVNAVVGDGADGWYIGGQFIQVGNAPHRNLSHILANGSVDTSWRMFPDGPVHALERLGAVLYVGGAFNNVADVSRRNVAAIRDSQELFTWDPRPNKAVRALKRFGNALYMGGDFTAGNGKPGFLAAFELQDQQLPLSDQPLPVDMNLDGPVRALATDGFEALYVGGSFHWFGDASQYALGKIAMVGAKPTAVPFRLNPGYGGNCFYTCSVNALVVAGGKTLYIGGSFPTIIGQDTITSRKNLAAAYTNGTLLDWAPDPDDIVNSLVADGGFVYAGGAFKTIGTGSGRFPSRNLAKIFAADGSVATNGSVDTSFGANPGATVRALAVSDTALYAGGDFTFLNGTDRSSLAAINADGSLLPWNPGADGPINALVFHNNRFHGPLVYVGGSFTSISGRPKSNLVALNALSGQVLESSFVGIANGPVNALAVLESSEALYVGGNFTSIAGSPVSNLAKLFLFNGTANLDFKPQPTGPVSTLIATTDTVHFTDVIYAGGSFTSIRKHDSTPTRVNLAKISADSGTALDEFVVNPNGAVTTLALSRDPHAIYVGGNFDRINGTLIGAPGAGGLAAVEIDGSPLLTGCNPCFNPGPDGGRPQALATFPFGFGGERVMVGGTFPNIGGGPISNFAALTGYSYGVPTGFSSGSFVFPNGPVSALAVVGNKVYIGGAFSGFYGSYDSSFGGAARGNFGVVDAGTGELIN